MNNSLQISLLVLGIIMVVGVLLYNKWQENKHRKKAEKAFRSQHRDVLLETQGKGRREPGISENSGIQPTPKSSDFAQPAGAESAGAGDRRKSPGLPGEVDPRLDCIIRIESIEPLTVSRIWPVQHDQLRGVQHPVRWYIFDETANTWRPMREDDPQAYHWFCAAMQLVDRRGAIDETTFIAFTEGVQRVADQFLAVAADMPTKVKSLQHAAEIDRFCASVDVQIGINIIKKEMPFSGTKIRSLAEADGMLLAADGAFHAIDNDGRTLYTLSNLEADGFSDNMKTMSTSGMTLIVDVPLVSNGAAVFDQMMSRAEHFALVLNGAIVDDNQSAFGPEAADFIRRQITEFQREMQEQNVPAGGILARRLFASSGS